MIHSASASYMRLSHRIPERNEIYRAWDQIGDYRYKVGDGRTELRDLPWMLNSQIPSQWTNAINLYDILKQAGEELQMSDVDEHELLSIIS